jgi:hypothetical protein
MFPPGDTPFPFMPNHDVAQHAGCSVSSTDGGCKQGDD